MKNAIFYFCLLLATGAQAQTRIEWEKSYGGSAWDQANSIRQTTDGGFIAAGYSQSADGDVGGNQGGEDIWIIKTDAVGNLQWEQNFGGSGNERAEEIRQTADSGYVVAGYSQSADGDVGGNNGLIDYWILKLDAAGNLQWEQNFGGSGVDVAKSIRQTADGGYVVAGYSPSTNGDVTGNKGGNDYWVLKLNADGEKVWARNFGGSNHDHAVSLELTTGGGFVLAGYSYSSDGDVGGNFGVQDYWVLKLDANGFLEWEQNFGGTNSDLPKEIQQTADGGYVVAGVSFSADGEVGVNYGVNDYWIVKLDASGNLQWEKVFGGISYDEAESIRQTTDGGYIIGGYTRTPEGNMGGTIIDEVWIVRIDPAGNLLWEERYGGMGIEQALSIVQTTDNGYIMTGVSEFPTGDVSENNGQLDLWIIKLSPLPGSIQGHVYLDNNENCVYDAGDSTLTGIVLMAEDTLNEITYYGYTDAQGHFLIETDTFPCLLRYALPSPYFDTAACSTPAQWIDLSGADPNGSFDFYVVSHIFCPYLTVDVAAPYIRRCFDSNYYVSYCNQGTVTADDAWVEVSFAPELTVVGSSIPWSTVDGNTYTFLLGDIEALECGQFSVAVNIGCDSTYVGQTLCAEAHIYPDSSCVPVENWSGAELKATATCIGTDSVELRLQNVGTADMPEAVPFLVIEDIIMRDAGQVQLIVQETASWKIPIDGLTQRIIAQQPDGHPFKTFTTAAVNLCNTENLPPLPGPVDDFYTTYPDDDEAPFVAIDCQEIVGSVDPNDKTVHPTGATAEGFITASTELTYKIRFQNTGTDTAFTVVVIDTIAPQLDLATFRPGASSHAYTADVYGEGIVKFTFRNILLPDSATNEAASHGFVQFRLQQKPGNEGGTVIQNQANIYFDFNPPIATNTVHNTIGQIYLEGNVSTEEVDGKQVVVHAFPNPARDMMTFRIEEATNGFDLLLYDVQGKLVQQVSTTDNSTSLYRNSLPDGLYFFEIRSGGRSVASGRLIFQ